MTREDLVAKAMSAVGQKTIYDLNAGTVGAACSCSRFVAWAFSLPVKLDVPLYKRWNGGWFESTAVYRDIESPFGFFGEVAWEKARPGDVLVWPDYAHKQGHMGIIIGVASGPVEVVHCSLGNWRRTGDAIQVTGPEVFAKNRAKVGVWHEFTEDVA